MIWTLAKGLVLALSSQGFAVDHVSLGQHALSSIKAKDCDAVILDLGLPDMDGAGCPKTKPSKRHSFARVGADGPRWGG